MICISWIYFQVRYLNDFKTFESMTFEWFENILAIANTLQFKNK